ncbi:MAG: DUF969 domain-containing protein [Planctomycetes bacterium]|nr:DUF969 domain-containing protein [Planctomycetota bacterium]
MTPDPAAIDSWKLIGVVIVALGFALRLPPLLVVLVAAGATGLVAGLDPLAVLEQLGTLFLDSRFTTLPIVLLMPLIGLLERHGLQERAAALISGAARATAGRVLLAYQAMRALTSMFGLAIGGHAQMIRPLVAPMAEGVAQARAKAPLPDALLDRLRAHAAAAENFGNFFADDVVVAVGPVLIMKGVFERAGVDVATHAIGAWGLPTALFALLLGAWRFRRLDQALAVAGGMASPAAEPPR